MDEEQVQGQEEKNNESSFLKSSKHKASSKAKDLFGKGKNTVKQAINKNPIVAKIKLILLAVLGGTVLAILLFAGGMYLLNYLTEKGASEAKQASISFNLAGSSATVEAGGTGTGGTGTGDAGTGDAGTGDAGTGDAGTGDAGTGSSGSSSSGSADTTEETRLTVQKTDEGNYEIVSNYTEEEFEELKNDRKLNIDIGDFSDFEKSVLYAFQENGMDLYDYTREELKCIPAFLKAEGCTQYLDLRENKDKQSGKKVGDYIDAYEPAKIEDLEENEIPGTILVQRTTTSETEPVTLQYMAETEFQELIDNNDIKAIDYFSMTDEGKLVIAKRSYRKVEVSGEYPESIPQEQREQSIEETIISKEEISYAEVIKKYVMPFDFLMQLLIITENPEFCLDLVDMVLDSKIVINIQEEETRTHKEETRVYTVHNKENKYIEYEVGNGIEKETNVFLKETKDDENKDCTTYSTEQFKVTVVTDTTTYTYKPEVIEADTWIGHYINEYDDPEEKVTEPAIEPQEIKEEYKQLESIQKTGADAEADPHAAKFKAAKEAEYKSKIPDAPKRIGVTEYSSGGKKYKQINIPNDKFYGSLNNYIYEGQPSIDDKGKTTYTYSLPGYFWINTKSGVCPATVQYNYTKNASDTYDLSGSNADTVFQCKILRLAIVPYQKTNLYITATEKITKFETDPEPKKTYRLYAKDEDGNLEKFLKILDEHKNARKMLFSVEEWLFEMMVENVNTNALEDTLKYLLYLYDGRNRGITDLDIEGIMKPMDMCLARGGNIPLTKPILSREDFIKALEEYDGGGNYVEDFRNNAGQIYDWGIKYGVNPELIVTFALKEQGFRRPSSGNYNYWGLDTPNGAGVKPYPTMESGIKRFGELVSWYIPGGKRESWITNIAEERKAAECNTNGYGQAGTLKGYLSVYSDLCGSNTKHREGSSGDGGNYYLKIIYGADFNAKCGSVHKIGVDDYTIQERADYTAYLYEQQIEYWTEIFGKYGSLGSGSEPLEVGYQYLNASASTMFDVMQIPETHWCAYFVTWTYREAGITVLDGAAGSYNNGLIGTCSTIINAGRKLGCYHPAGDGYIPQPGDLMFMFGSNLQHVGLVVEYNGGDTITTLEGNTSRKCSLWYYCR